MTSLAASRALTALAFCVSTTTLVGCFSSSEARVDASAADASAAVDASAADSALADAAQLPDADPCANLACACDLASPTRECPLGYGCAGTVCLPGCDRDEDCSVGRACRRSNLSCYTPGAPVGMACTRSEECDLGCRTEAEGPPGGECIGAICDLMLNDCAEGQTCTPLGEGVGSCHPACVLDGDCRPSFRCRPDPTLGRRSCVPGCTQNSDCATTMRCDVASGYCRS